MPRKNEERLGIFNLFQVLLFDRTVGTAVQLDVIEPYGIMVFRTSHADAGGGRVLVVRLADLDEFLEEDEPAIGNDINVPTWEPR